jgi:prepilin-type N-terminal cleavage/methylation domain-containing protein
MSGIDPEPKEPLVTNHHRRARITGFTLIELLVVIAVLAVLIAMVQPGGDVVHVVVIC